MWIAPWIFAGIFSYFLLRSPKPKKKYLVPIQNEDQKQSTKPISEETSENKDTKEGIPITENKNFDWVDLDWLENPHLEHLPSRGKLTFAGQEEGLINFNSEVIETYNSTLSSHEPKYNVVPDCYFSPDGYYFVNKLPYPHSHPYLPPVDPFLVQGFETAIDIPETIGLPIYYTLSPCSQVLMALSIICAAPKSLLSGKTLLLTNGFEGLVDFVKPLGIDKQHIQFITGSWVRSNNMVVFQSPDPKVYHLRTMQTFIRIQRSNFELRSFGDKFFILPSEDFGKVKSYENFTQQLINKDARIRMAPLGRNLKDHAEFFHRAKVIISTSTDPLNLLPFMRPGTFAIIIHESYTYLYPVHIANLFGVNVHLIPIPKKNEYSDDVVNEVIRALKVYMDEDPDEN